MKKKDRPHIATIWLSGCSGCHMSFLDQDEFLIDLGKMVRVVYSPIMDIKKFPENVDVTLIEGAVGNEEQLSLLREAREKTTTLISLGDCAVTGNVTALRNAWEEGDQAVLKRAYIETADVSPQIPTEVPRLLKRAHPLHEIVNVDYFIPGCPPPANLIRYVMTELLEGRKPDMNSRSKYG